MANDFTAMSSALYSVLNAAATVDVYYALAPQGSTPPYTIFQRSAAVDDYTFTSSGVSADYIVKVISNQKSIPAIYGYIEIWVNFNANTCSNRKRHSNRTIFHPFGLQWSQYMPFIV